MISFLMQRICPDEYNKLHAIVGKCAILVLSPLFWTQLVSWNLRAHTAKLCGVSTVKNTHKTRTVVLVIHRAPLHVLLYHQPNSDDFQTVEEHVKSQDNQLLSKGFRDISIQHVLPPRRKPERKFAFLFIMNSFILLPILFAFIPLVHTVVVYNVDKRSIVLVRRNARTCLLDNIGKERINQGWQKSRT